MGKLDGKVAIITGAAQGMGASHVKLFVNEGAKVVLTDIQDEAGKALAAELGENALFIKHDVTNYDEWKHVVKAAEENFGPVDILINNAGTSGPALSIEELDIEGYQKIVDINQTSVFYGLKAVVPSMKKTKAGSIINISSVAGLAGAPKALPYITSKFAVRGMTKAAAADLAEFGITVNSVHPGVIETPMVIDYGKTEDGKTYLDNMKQGIPLNRFAQVEEVSKLVVFLASDDANYSTGSEFVIDGGVTSQQ
ncbi:glucose 1-dehydrogenase [Oceanobacillus sp. CAU 1775]